VTYTLDLVETTHEGRHLAVSNEDLWIVAIDLGDCAKLLANIDLLNCVHLAELDALARKPRDELAVVVSESTREARSEVSAGCSRGSR
jgi:hypothetical protein